VQPVQLKDASGVIGMDHGYVFHGLFLELHEKQEIVLYQRFQSISTNYGSMDVVGKENGTGKPARRRRS
jgi:hypothetical protein